VAEQAARLVIVDRDGVVNEDSADYIKSVAEWQPIAGSLEAIAELAKAGYRVAVVTNQSGVARGLFDEATLEAIHGRMRSAVRAAGGELAGIYYCPHLPSAGCDCRKPRPGLFRQLEQALGVSVRGVPYVGDKLTDVDAAEAVGARPMLVRTGKGAKLEQAARERGVPIFDDLRAAARSILDERRT
jgi:D-glycero-D-manno-heptose 1,7-bisphosphate phosphatase